MDLDSILSPALIVDLDRVRHNLGVIHDLLGGDWSRWRPHLKTTKLPRVWSLLIEAGVRAFKVATTREARVFLELGDDLGPLDLLVAYPLQGPALHQLDVLARAHPDVRVSLLSEDPAHASRVPAGLGLFIDVNVGMDRTGVPASDHARLLAVARAAGPRLRGLHGYEGHVHGAPLEARRAACHEALEGLRSAQRVLLDAGHQVEQTITSGTPSFYPALSFEGLRGHQVSPGTVVFHDARSARYEELRGLRPAARVLTRVISHPRPGRFTCDAGSKALAAEVAPPCVVVEGHPAWSPRAPSEEHLPVDLPEGEARPGLGEALMLIPQHVCPTVNLAERAALVEGGEVIGEGVIAARAHDLWWPPRRSG